MHVSDLKISELNAVPTHAYPSAARRPVNSLLDTTKFRDVFGLELPHWHKGVEDTLRQLLQRWWLVTYADVQEKNVRRTPPWPSPW